VDPKLKARIAAVTAKRARTFLDHVLKHGKVTTDELKRVYGYSHPPRAARDVREEGIPLLTTSEPGPDGRAMAVYTIDESVQFYSTKAGRRAFPKSLKDALLARDGERCALCGGRFPPGALQVDHRIPYEVGGDADTIDGADFMLVCGSCNRAKSWSCEHCPNWTAKVLATCGSCLWASPLAYAHVATDNKRRLDVVWEGDEVGDYDELAKRGDVRAAVKELVRRTLRGDPKG
jgi:hypothetical protein